MMKKITMEVNGYHQRFGYQHSSKYLLLCSTEKRISFRFETSFLNSHNHKMQTKNHYCPKMVPNQFRIHAGKCVLTSVKENGSVYCAPFKPWPHMCDKPVNFGKSYVKSKHTVLCDCCVFVPVDNRRADLADSLYWVPAAVCQWKVCHDAHFSATTALSFLWQIRDPTINRQSFDKNESLKLPRRSKVDVSY